MVPSVAAHLGGVLREALSNVARHAEAQRVEITLETGDEVVLTVRDDGRGVPAGAVHSGLLNMRERAEQLGGTCVSSPLRVAVRRSSGASPRETGTKVPRDRGPVLAAQDPRT